MKNPLGRGKLALLVSGMLLSAAALAQAGPVDLDIPAQPLGQALNALARQSGAQILFVSDVAAGKTAPALKGRLTVAEALQRLLSGTGLSVQADDERTFAVVRPPASALADKLLPAVNVTAAPEPSELPRAYAGGQVARGANLGMLGNQDIMNTPFNVTSYTAQTIEDQQARSLADVLANDPSTRSVSPVGGLSDDFAVRGFALNSTDIAMNGMYGLLPYYRVPAEVMERVEVLKGPSALLNGMSPSGAVGGSINVVTKRADDVPLSRLTAGYISDSQFLTKIDVGRRFGDDHQIGIRVNGVYRNGDTGIDHNSEKLAMGSLGLDYRGADLRLSLDVISQDDDQDGTRRQPMFASGQIPAPPSNTVNWLPNAYSHQRDNTVLAHGEYDLTDSLTGYASVGYRKSKSELLLGNPTPDAQGAFQASLAYWNAYAETTSAEAGLRYQLDTGPVRHRFVFSGNLLKENDGRVLSNFSTPVPSNIYDPATPNLPAAYPGAIPKVGESTLSGVALADTMSFAQDRALLTLGLRRQHVYTKSFGGGQTSYEADATTPMAGLVVKPWSKDVSLYANYIEGLSAGSTVTDTLAANYNTTFPPYKSKQMEAGVKYDLGRLATTVSAFQITKPSLFSSSATHVYDQNKQRNRGLEWSVFGEVADHVRLLGGVAYTQALLTQTHSANDDNVAPGVPRWQGNIGAEWDTPFVPRLTVFGRALFTGKQYVNTANTQSIPGWVRYDLGARYRTTVGGKNVVLRATVENLFDRNYWASLTSSGYLTLSAPRTVMLSASVDF